MYRNVTRYLPDRLRAVAQPLAIAVLAGAAGTIGSYAVAGSTQGFVAAAIAGFLARTLPGEVLTAAILVLGSLGQQLNLLTAIGVATAGFAVLTGFALWAGRHLGRPLLGAPLSAALSGLLAFLLTGVPGPALGAAIGVGVVVTVATVERPGVTTAPDHGRRQALRALAGAIAVGVLGIGARRSGDGPLFGVGMPSGSRGSGGGGSGDGDGAGNGDGGDRGPGAGDGPVSPAAEPFLGEAREKSLDVEGIEPLVSEAFYEVDISAVNPDLRADDWALSFTGAVAEERTIDYETLTSAEAEHRFVTLRCVGEQLNGHKMDNALWTGAPVAGLLEELDVRSDCECVMLRAADDYYEEFPLAALRTGFLAWGMNGRDLPRAHGYPVRALIPGHWGEINVKWLTEIEFLDRQTDGFWEERGWHGTGPVNTVAKLHAVNHLDGDRIQVGGHAYAGTRGIHAVEVSVDGGERWTEATLSAPLPGEDVWRQWVHEYDSPGGRHEVVVRAIDGTGEVQPREQASPYPNGPSGWVRQRVQG